MNRRGSVLITVTWILAVLAIFTLAINRRVSQELFLGQWIRDRVVARTIAKAGVERALFEIQADEFIAFDTLGEGWASNEVAFNGVELGDGRLYVSCHDFDDEKNKVNADEMIYGACDESAKLNVNKASEDQIRKLVFAVDDTVDDNKQMIIAQSIIDWRDSDDTTMTFGAEGNYYKAFAGRERPRNAPLATVQELRMIRGITSELFEKIEPYVTVYTEGAVNFNTAPVPVLQALGIGEELAQRIVDFRKGEDGRVGTEDDAIFQLPDGISAAISQGGKFNSEDFAQISNLVAQKMVGVSADAFSIRSIGRFIKNSRTFDYLVYCVVKREGDILFWREEVR